MGICMSLDESMASIVTLGSKLWSTSKTFQLDERTAHSMFGPERKEWNMHGGSTRPWIRSYHRGVISGITYPKYFRQRRDRYTTTQ